MPVGRRIRLSGEVWLDWSYYRRYTTERSTDPGGEGRAEIDVGPVTLIGGGGGYQARELYSIDIDERTLRQEEWVYGGADWRLTRFFSLSGGAEWRSSKYDPTRATGDPLTAASLNRNSTSARLEGRYRLTSMTTALASAEVIEDEFVVAQPSVAKTRSYRYLGGFELGERAFLSGKVLVGFRDFPSASSGSLPSYRGPAAQVEVALPVRSFGRLVGTAGRDVYVASTPVLGVGDRARNAYILTTLNGSAEVDLPLELLGRFTAGFQEAEYLVPQTVSGVSFPRVEHLYSTGFSLLRRFSDSLRAGATATYYRRVSTIPGQSYDRWVYGISAELLP
jgi:hypothetical protein